MQLSKILIPELGNLSIILALCLSIFQSSVPWIGVYYNDRRWMRLSHPVIRAHFLCLLIAFTILAYSFISNNFSVSYVANNSSITLPWYYRLSAVWGAHEGSLLLWTLILSGWTLSVSIFSEGLPEKMLIRILSVMGMISVGFLIILIDTSNPFLRTFPYLPQGGSDLNPLLQDIGLIIHPPILYMGYVGFSVSFAFAVAALLEDRLDAAWVRWVRPWVLLAWAFLGIGIVLGSWWAYCELGWGGWWFWDPVENASFMPWLIGTALIHSLSITEKKGIAKRWTILLAIGTFFLSLLGTFIVRSGSLSSVHAFASDPKRGLFILVLLFVIIGASLLLFASKVSSFRNEAYLRKSSREIFLLINNILLVSACSIVFLGTLYPMLLEAVGSENRISVGEPYFVGLLAPLMSILLFSMGIGTILRWKKTPINWLLRMLSPVLLASIGLSWIASLVYLDSNWSAITIIALTSWVILSGLRDIADKIKYQSLILGLRKLKVGYWGMQLAHIGVAICALGMVLSTQYSVERSLYLDPEHSIKVGNYDFLFEGVRVHSGNHFISTKATIQVMNRGKNITSLYPEKRLYLTQGTMTTEAAIAVSLIQDIYVTLGEPLSNGRWSMKIQIKPFVRLIWLGGIMTAIGGLCVARDNRSLAKK